MFLTKEALDNIKCDEFNIVATCQHDLMDTSVYPPIVAESITSGSVLRVVKKWNNSSKSFVLHGSDGREHWRFPLHVYDDSNYGFSIEPSCS